MNEKERTQRVGDVKQFGLAGEEERAERPASYEVCPEMTLSTSDVFPKCQMRILNQSSLGLSWCKMLFNCKEAKCDPFPSPTVLPVRPSSSPCPHRNCVWFLQPQDTPHPCPDHVTLTSPQLLGPSWLHWISLLSRSITVLTLQTFCQVSYVIFLSDSRPLWRTFLWLTSPSSQISFFFSCCFTLSSYSFFLIQIFSGLFYIILLFGHQMLGNVWMWLISNSFCLTSSGIPTMSTR